MGSVFMASHERESPEGHDDLKIIGIFETAAQAHAAIESLRDKEGFRDYPEGFEVSELELGQVGWTEGFISGKEALDALPKP